MHFDLARPGSCVERLEPRTLLSLAPAGAEFRANSFTTNSQSSAAVAADADGDFVVVWQSFGQDGTSPATYGVYARLYDAAGVPRGPEFRVNTTTAGSQSAPAVAMDADGDFVVAWSGNGLTDTAGVFFTRYNSLGVALSGELRVNAFTTGVQSAPAVAMDAAGNFVIAWESQAQDGSALGVYARRQSSTGVGPELRVNTFTTGDQRTPDLAMDASGDFVVTWISSGQDGNFEGVYAQRFDASAAARGNEFRVNTFTTNIQGFGPSVAMDAGGDFVVAWTSYAQDPDASSGIYAQRYDDAGATRGSEFRVNTFTTSLQWRPDVAMDADGDILVTWESVNQDGSLYGIYAQSFNAAGTPVGNEFRVNTFTTGTQVIASVAMSPTGDAVVAWQSNGQDGSSNGVFAQRYEESAPDTAAPVVTGLLIEGSPIPPGSQLFNVVSSLVLSFSEELSVDGGAAGPGSATNPASYALMLNGIDVSSHIVSVDFAFNAFTRKYEATLILIPALAGGSYVVSARDALRDLAGNALDGDLDGFAGVDSTHGFSIVLLPEFRVNTFTEQRQSDAAVAMDADGDFVVVWQSFGQDGNNYGIVGRRYSAANAAQGDEFRVNVHTAGEQAFPAVAMASAGDFVVAWQGSGPGDATGIFARRFNAAGVPLGDQFRVNTLTTGEQSLPSVAVNADGDFVVVWQSFGGGGGGRDVYAQRYNPSGAPQGSEFRVNTFTTGAQGLPAAAIDPDGDLVITWTDGDPTTNGQDGSLSGVYAQRFDSDGIAQGGEFRVNTLTADQQSHSVVAMDASGDFVIAWESNLADGSLHGIYAQRYDASGVPQGPEFRVNETTSGEQRFPSIAMQADGAFSVAWDDRTVGGIYSQRYDAAGARQGEEFRVDTRGPADPTGSGSSPAAASDPHGSLVVAWEAADLVSSDIYARKYARAAVTSSSFRFQDAPHRLTFTFGASVLASLGTDDLVVENLTTMQTIPSGDISLSYDASTNTATFRYTGNASGIAGVLPDGNYRATLLASGITNPGGTPMSADHVFPFFFLNGDANHDGGVNLQDFNVLASHFGRQPRNFTQGDFNYDGTVNLIDFNLLAARFGQSVAPFGTAAISGKRTTDDDADDVEQWGDLLG